MFLNFENSSGLHFENLSQNQCTSKNPATGIGTLTSILLRILQLFDKTLSLESMKDRHSSHISWDKTPVRVKLSVLK